MVPWCRGRQTVSWPSVVQWGAHLPLGTLRVLPRARGFSNLDPVGTWAMLNAPTDRPTEREHADAPTAHRERRAQRPIGVGMDQAAGMSGGIVRAATAPASQFLPPCRFAAKALAARRENIGRTRLATKGTWPPIRQRLQEATHHTGIYAPGRPRSPHPCCECCCCCGCHHLCTRHDSPPRVVAV